MIKTIGIKLVGILAILIAMNLFLLFIWLFWATPTKEDAEINLASINSEISRLRSSITNIKEEITYYNANKAKFDELKKIGFTTEQNRLTIAKNLNDIRQASLVQNLKYNISDMVIIDNKSVQKLSHQLVKMTINLTNINAYFDTDIYKFTHMLNNKFGGHVRLLSVSLKRQPPEMFSDIIDKITNNKENIYTVTGDIDFEWYAILKQPEEETSPAGIKANY